MDKQYNILDCRDHRRSPGESDQQVDQGEIIGRGASQAGPHTGRAR